MTLKLQCFENFTLINYIFGWDRNNTYFSLSSLTLPLQNNVVTKLLRIFTNTHTWYHYKASGRGEHFLKKTSDSKCFDLIFLHTVQEFFNSIMLMRPILARTLVRNIHIHDVISNYLIQIWMSYPNEGQFRLFVNLHVFL